MTSQETAASYDKLAGHWSGDKFNHENGLAQHKRALQFTLNRNSAIDVGCGSSGRIIEFLLSEGFTVEGIDISGEMLRFAREKHPKITFHQADICEWTFLQTYDFISAWDSAWHVPAELQSHVLVKLCAALNPDGVLIYSTGGLDRPGHITNPFLGQPLYHAGWGVSDLLETLSKCGCICRHLEYDQHPEKHLYIVAQKVEQDAAANP